MGKENKIFCTAPFTTLRIESYSNYMGTVFKPGCVYHAQDPIPTLEEYQTGAEMTAHRRNLLTGTIPSPGCRACSEPESNGLSSTRALLSSKPWASDKEKIFLLDMFFSNVCNLGCLMCGPEFSSYIANERFNAGIIPKIIEIKDNTQIILETMDKLPDLTSVTFIGGEFFIAKRNLEILDRVIERGLECSIATNATVINDAIFARLKKIKNIELKISVDGTNGCYEFIRYPANWDILNSNITRFKEELPTAKFLINTVIQPLNLQNLHELFEWANKKYIKTIFQYISTPTYLSWGILNKQEQDKLAKLLQQKQNQGFKITKQQHKGIDDLIDAIQNIEFSPKFRLAGVRFMSKLMLYRKIDPSIIKKQFGILTDLAQEIINES